MIKCEYREVEQVEMKRIITSAKCDICGCDLEINKMGENLECIGLTTSFPGFEGEEQEDYELCSGDCVMKLIEEISTDKSVSVTDVMIQFSGEKEIKMFLDTTKSKNECSN